MCRSGDAEGRRRQRAQLLRGKPDLDVPGFMSDGHGLISSRTGQLADVVERVPLQDGVVDLVLLGS